MLFHKKENAIEITTTCGTCGAEITGNMKGDMVAFKNAPCEHFLALWKRVKITAFIEVARKPKAGVDSKER